MTRQCALDFMSPRYVPELATKGGDTLIGILGARRGKARRRFRPPRPAALLEGRLPSLL